MLLEKSRALIVFVVLTLLLGVVTASEPADAAPYVGADLVLDGSDFSAASSAWNVDGAAIWSNTQDEWAEYDVDLTAGRWQTGIEAINEGSLGSDPDWYPQYELSVSLSSELLTVQASATEVHHGFVEFDIPADGTYTARFTWLNDLADGPLPGGGFERDANIRIERVFFDSVPDIASGLWFENPENGHVYSLLEGGLTFAEAEAQAVAWGGHLVTINDPAEQNWLYETFGSWSYTIGLNDADEEGTFVWVSGEPVTYTNWCPGEPNEVPPGEDTVHMVRGAQCWNDVSGEWTLAIVEAEPMFSPAFHVAYDSEGGLDDFVHLHNWLPGSTLTISIDDPATVPVVDHQVSDIEVASLDAFNVVLGPDWDVMTGHEVTVTDGIRSLTHVVTNLQITDVNPETDLVTGVAEFGKYVYVGSHEFPVGDYTVDPLPDGSWQVDMSSDDLRPGYDLIAHQYDENSNTTQTGYHIPLRHFKVHHGDDFVVFSGWVEGTTLNVSIDDPATGPGADYEIADLAVPHTGDFDTEFAAEFDVQPGHVVTVSDGSYSLTHTVRDLVVTAADPDTDLVAGTANPGEQVVVSLWSDDVVLGDVFVDPELDGSWQADLSGLDLQAGAQIEVAQYEELPAGSAGTGFFYWIPALSHPTLTVFMSFDFAETNGISGFDFLPSSQVTLAVDLGADGSIDYEDTATVDDGGGVRFDSGFPTVQEGDVVTLTDDLDPPRVKSHVVGHFTLTGVDDDTNVVTGTGSPGTELHIRAIDPTLTFPEGPDIILTVDSGGNWAADFSGICDIGPGTSGWAQTDDADGDHTQINWWVSLPEPGSWIYNAATGHYYALTDGGLTFLQAEDAAESWAAHLVTIDDQAEQDWLYETFGVNPLWIGFNDIETEGVFVWTSGAPTIYTNWCDGEPNDHDPGEDATMFAWDQGVACWNDMPDDAQSMGIVELDSSPMVPFIELNSTHGDLTGAGWPAGAVVAVTVDDPDTADPADFVTDATVYQEGPGVFDTAFHVNLWEAFGEGFELRPGLYVTVADGITTKVLEVADITVSDVDLAADIITGTAVAGANITVFVFIDHGVNAPAVYATADSTGNWMADLTGVHDLVPGSQFTAGQSDADGDITFLIWDIPLPGHRSWRYNPATGHYYARTDDDLTFAQAEEMAQDFGGHLVTVDDQAEQDWLYETFGLQPWWIGFNDIDTEGTFVWTSGAPATYTNWCDGEPNDTFPGEDAAQMEHEVGDRCWNDVPLDSRVSGIVEVDSLERIVTIQASITHDSLHGNGWPAGATVTITMDDPDTPEPIDYQTQADVTQYGAGPFDTELHVDLQVAFEGQFQVTAGQIFTVTDGITTKVLEVADLVVVEANRETDTVTGTAAPGAELEVWVEAPEYHAVAVTADAAGNWTADFSGILDLDYAFPGGVQQLDADGDATEVRWEVPNPQLGANPWLDYVGAWEWPLGALATLTVDNDFDVGNGVLHEATATVEQFEDSLYTRALFDLIGAFDVQAGHVLTVSDGTVTKTHQVTSVELTEIDLEADTMGGVADPFAVVNVEAWTDNNGAGRRVTADAAGNWIADFSYQPTEDDYDGGNWGSVDLRGNYDFGFYEQDDEGDSTGWEKPQGAPGMLAVPDLDVINIDATGLSPVILTIESAGGEVLYEDTFDVVRGGQAGDLGGFNFPDHYPFINSPIGYPGARLELDGVLDLAPGQVITWSDIAYTVELVVSELSVTEVDVDADVALGTYGSPATGVWGALQDFAAYGFTEPVGGDWTMSFCEAEAQLADGTCVPWDVVHDDLGLALAYDDSPFRNYTGAVWDLLPTITELTLPTDPVSIALPVDVSASFVDLEVPDTHTATVDWGDGTPVETLDVTPAAGSGSGGTIAGAHAYEEAGTYDVTLTVTDASGSADSRSATVEITRVVFYRLNAGGPEIAATDGGPNWAEDSRANPSPFVNTGNMGCRANPGSGGCTYLTVSAIDMTDPSLPSYAPEALFQTERWDDPNSTEMRYMLPLPDGTYTVRLYFAEIYGGTQGSGLRVFDVNLSGLAPALDNYDVYAEVGGYKGVMKEFIATVSAGVLQIDFAHVIENPAIKGIEVIEALLDDDDQDGVSDSIENDAPNNGDGNGDGIPDSEQDNVASLPNEVTDEYITLESPDPISEVVTTAPPVTPPDNIDMPVGLMSFVVDPISTSALTVTLYLPLNPEIDDYWKYGPTTDDPADHWYRFMFDGTTGAEISHETDRTVITLHFVDGQRGDHDLVANGRLVDPGGPAIILNQPPVADDDAYTTNEDTMLTVDAPGVLANDVDEDGDPLTAVLATGPDHGTVTLNANGSFTYAPNDDWNGTDTFTYVSNDGQFDSNEATVTIEVTAVNDPPIGTATPAAQTVQYSDAMAPIAIAVDDIDSTSVSATATGFPDGITLTGGPCDFPCEFTLSGAAADVAGTYNAIVTLVDDGAATSDVPVTIIVQPEDASIAFHGGNAVAVRVEDAGGDSGTFDLMVRVREMEPDLAFGVPLPGDLDLADLAMRLVPVGPGGTADPVGECERRLDGEAYDQQLTVTCAFNLVPVNAYMVEVTVDGGFYEGAADDVVVVYDPSLGYTTGGGSFLWPDTDEVVNFGYTMEYNKKGKNVKGSLLLIRHLADGSTYQVKSNALGGLALGEGDGFGWASFNGKATYLGPGMDEPEGNHEFIVYLEDRNEPGAGIDQFWIEVHDKADAVIPALSMDRDAVDNTVPLEGGNLVVPHGAG